MISLPIQSFIYPNCKETLGWVHRIVGHSNQYSVHYCAAYFDKYCVVGHTSILRVMKMRSISEKLRLEV